MTDHNARTQLSDALRWALDTMQSPALASADWLAMEIDPHTNSAADLLSNPTITLEQVRKAKSVFKTMRIVGETSADRRIGARMYAAAIAAGIVRHGRRISRQSDAAIMRAMQGLVDDRRMPEDLRKLAGMAMCSFADHKDHKDHQELGDDALHNGHAHNTSSTLANSSGENQDDTLPLLDDD
jgi:hypothetical protein